MAEHPLAVMTNGIIISDDGCYDRRPLPSSLARGLDHRMAAHYPHRANSSNDEEAAKFGTIYSSMGK